MTLSGLLRSIQRIPLQGKQSFSQKQVIQHIFNRTKKLKHKENSLKLHDPGQYDHLKNELGERLADRVFDVKRTFSNCLALGSGKGYMSQFLDEQSVNNVVSLDSSFEHLFQSYVNPDIKDRLNSVCYDEEYINGLFRSNTFDLVVSPFSLQWVNNIPSLFKTVNDVLIPDGCFLGGTFYGETLHELMRSLYYAEVEKLDVGITPRVSPFVKCDDIARLLHQSKFVLITCDTDEIQVAFPSMKHLIEDLIGMAEQASFIAENRPRLTEEATALASEYYKENFDDGEGNIVATFQIVYWIAWKKDPSQPQPLERGSGQFSFEDIGKVTPPTKGCKV